MLDIDERPITELLRLTKLKKVELTQTFFVWVIRACGGIIGTSLLDNKYTREGITKGYPEFSTLITIPQSTQKVFGDYVLSLTQNENSNLSDLIGMCMGKNASSVINQFHEIAIVSDRLSRTSIPPSKKRCRWFYPVPKQHMQGIRSRVSEYKCIFNAMSATWQSRVALNQRCTRIEVSQYGENNIASIMCRRYLDLFFRFLDRSDIKRPTYVIAQQLLSVIIFYLIEQLRKCDHPIIQTLAIELRSMLVRSLGEYRYPRKIEIFIKDSLLQRECEHFLKYVEQQLAVNHYEPKYINHDTDQYEQYEANLIEHVAGKLQGLTFVQKIGLLAYLDYHHPDNDEFDIVSDNLYNSTPNYTLPQWAATFLVHTAVHNNYAASLSQLFSYFGTRFNWIKVLNVVQYSIHDSVQFSKIPRVTCITKNVEYVYLPDYKIDDSPLSMPIVAESML